MDIANRIITVSTYFFSEAMKSRHNNCNCQNWRIPFLTPGRNPFPATNKYTHPIVFTIFPVDNAIHNICIAAMIRKTNRWISISFKITRNETFIFLFLKIEWSSAMAYSVLRWKLSGMHRCLQNYQIVMLLYGITSSTAGAICHLSSILPITILLFGRNLVKLSLSNQN